MNYSKQDWLLKNKDRRHSHMKRSRRIFEDLLSRSGETSSEDEIDYSNFDYHHSRNVQLNTTRYLSSLKNVGRSRVNQQRDRFSYPVLDIYQACQVIMIYRKDSLRSDQKDEILIKQKQTKDESPIIVYKGYLTKGDTFSFKSQHHIEYLFDVKFYINGQTNIHLKTCCEYKYRQSEVRLSQAFLLQRVVKSIPCQRCRRREMKENDENMNSSHRRSSNEQDLKNRDQRTNGDDTIQTPIQIPDHQSPIRRNEMISSSSTDKKKSTQVQEETPISPPNANESKENPSTAESEDHMINPFHRLLAERTSNDNDNNSGGLYQSILSLLRNGVVPQVETHQSFPSRYEGNVEDFVVILFGITDDTNRIRSIVNFVKTIDNIEELNSLINNLKYEKLILIINNSLFESIDNPTRFHSIYLLSTNPTRVTIHSNIRGYFLNLQPIVDQLEEECSIENDFPSIQWILPHQTVHQSFTYSQLLKETLLTEDQEGDSKKDLLDFVRFHYQHNSIQLSFINQFEHEFTDDQAIWWFTQNTFIRRILNRALRTQEVDILFKMRWFIQTLNKHIKDHSHSQIVYYLSSNKFEHQSPVEYHNGLISFGTFLHCQSDKPSSINEIKSILFEIETSSTEFFLPLDNIYRIQSIEEHQHWWLIHLNNDYEQLTNQIRIEITSQVMIIQLAKLLLFNEDYSQADYIARLLFTDRSCEGNPTLLASLAAIHHLLGSEDNRKKNYQAARQQFEQSLKIFLTFIPDDNSILSATYNNIGSMFYQDDQYEQAIYYHQKALQCQLKSSSPDMDAIATYSGNIGAVYLDQSKYEQALIYYQRSLRILQQSTPGKESLAIAMIYDRLASVYWRMDRANEALPCYQQALQLELKYLPENDHKISVSYFNLSTAYAKLNRLDDAIDCADKSVQQLLKSVPVDHPEVKENTEQLEALRRKKWLEQLYQ